MYKRLGIKKVVFFFGQVDWYGCGKNIGRCFGIVFDDMFEYFYMSRWIFFCCFENLRETVRYFFIILDEAGVSYWLEGGSLLGVVRYGDVILWDYDIDIGIYQYEISKCLYFVEVEKYSNAGKLFIDN